MGILDRYIERSGNWLIISVRYFGVVFTQNCSFLNNYYSIIRQQKDNLLVLFHCKHKTTWY